MIKNKERNLAFYYQHILSAAVVLVFFTNFDTYLSYTIAAPQPKIWIIIFLIASIPLFLSLKSRIKYISKAVFFWIYGYVLVSFFSLLIDINNFSGASSEELNTRILSSIFLITCLFIFSKYSHMQIWTRYIILSVTLMNVIANIYGFFYPDSFITIVEDQSASITGRSAGFYVDANRAGCVLITGMIFSINLIPQKYRLIFILTIFIGIFVTFSRSASLCFLIVVTILIAKGEISCKKVILQISILFSLAFLLSSILGFNWLSAIENSGLTNPNLDRLTQTQDDSALARANVVHITWQEILQAPILGHGTGYGFRLSEKPGIGSIRAHNMYLLFMLDHGFLGAFFLPLLLFLATRGFRGKNKTIGLTFSVLILLWSFFSHNILEHREFLMSFSLISAMSITNQIDHDSQSSRKHFVEV